MALALDTLTRTLAVNDPPEVQQAVGEVFTIESVRNENSYSLLAVGVPRHISRYVYYIIQQWGGIALGQPTLFIRWTYYRYRFRGRV